MVGWSLSEKKYDNGYTILKGCGPKMSGNKNKGWGFGKWTRIEMEMIKSPAFVNLSGSAQYLMLLFLMKRSLTFPKDRKNGKGAMVVENIDDITLTYKELLAPPFNWTVPRFTRARDQLMAHGFIRIVHRGGAYKKDKNVYGLSDHWKTWTPKHDPIFKRKRDVRRGFQKEATPY